MAVESLPPFLFLHRIDFYLPVMKKSILKVLFCSACLFNCPAVFSQTPVWHLVPEKANYPRGEAVVAGFTADAATYGSGAIDATAYLQNLLNQLDKASGRGVNMWSNMELVGGGVLYLPAGKYLINGKLLIPKGVTIRGDWKKPVKGQAIEGTILMTDYGRNNSSESESFITMQSGAALMDLAIWYPQQTGATPYSPTVLMGHPGGPHGDEFCNVKNVTLVNAWDGVIFSQIGGTCPTINGLYGTPLHQGVEIDRIVDIGRIEHIDFSPAYWAHSGLEGAPAIDDPVFRDHLYNNATGVVMRRNDWSYTLYLKVEGYNKGFHTLRSRQQDSYGWATPNGHNYGFEFIGCKHGLYFESSAGEGCMFAEVKTTGCEFGAYFTENAGGVAQFYKWDISATKCAIYTDPKATTKITMMESIVKAGKVLLQGGTFVAVNNDFNNPQPQIELESNSRGNITGNRFSKDVQIAENSTFQNVINHTPVTMEPIPAYTEFVPRTTKPSGTAFIVATAAPYNAPRGTKDNFPNNATVSDATTAIQNALDAAALQGGGIVYLPPGHYRIDGQLVIPSGVELKGSMDVSAFPLGPGSVLQIYNQTDVAVIMEANSGMRGINFNYPTQVYCTVMPNPIDFPFSIRGNGENIYIVNVAMRCSNRGVDLFTNSCNNFYIDYLTGYFFREGVNIRNSKDGVLANMQCNTIVYNNGDEVKFGQYQNSNRSTCGSPDDKDPYLYNSRNMTFLMLEDVENILMYGDFNYNSLVGIHVKSNVSGLALGFALDDDRTMLLLDGSNIHLDFINLQGVALQRGTTSDGLSSYIKTTANYTAESEVNFFNSDYWGYAGQSGIVADGAGTINMYGGNFQHSGVNSFARVNNGNLNVIGSVINPANNNNATYTGTGRSGVVTIGSITKGDSSVDNSSNTNFTHSPTTTFKAGILNDCNTWTATATYTNGGAAQNMVNCNTDDRWNSGWQNQGTGRESVTVTVDMKSNQTFNQVILDYSSAPNDGPETYILEVSTDGNSWTEVVRGSGRNPNMTIISFPVQTARYVRITKPSSNTDNFWAIDNFYVSSVTPPTDVHSIPFTADGSPNPVPVAGIIMDGAVSVPMNSSITLTPIITPGNAANRDVVFAIVNGGDKISLNAYTGVVTGVKTGTASVRATTSDGGFTATVIVTVLPECHPIRTILIADHGDATRPVRYLRADASGKLLWAENADDNCVWYEIPVSDSNNDFYFKNVATNQYLYRDDTGVTIGCSAPSCDWLWEAAKLSDKNEKTDYYKFRRIVSSWGGTCYWLVNHAAADFSKPISAKVQFVLSGINKFQDAGNPPEYPAVVMHTMPNDNNIWTSVTISTVNVDVCNPDIDDDVVIIEPVTFAPEYVFLSDLNIYPNPANDVVTITGLEGGELITIFNLAGNCVFQTIAAGDRENISISGLPKGLYLVKITKGKAEKTVKIIVM